MDIDSFFPFESYRDNQKECIIDILEQFEDGYKFYVLEASTGLGKSGVGYTVAKFMLNDTSNGNMKMNGSYGPPIIICTSTKNLQQQYINEFDDVRRIWSASNYSCNLYAEIGQYDAINEEMYYGSPLCLKDKCQYFIECNYRVDKKRFMDSKIGILNYYYYLHSREFAPTLLICDEAHNLENILCSVIAVTISKMNLSSILKTANSMDIRDYTDDDIDDTIDSVFGIKSLQDEADKTILILLADELLDIANHTEKLIKGIKDKIEIAQSNKIDHIVQTRLNKLSSLYRRADNLYEKINDFISSEARWIISECNDNRLVLKPLDLSEISEAFTKVPKNMIFMSATICGHKEFCRELGIMEDEFKGISISSPIPIENRGIYSFNLGPLNSKNIDALFPDFVKMIDKLLDKMENDKGESRGIIHSVSYKNAQKIIEHSKHKSRMIIPNGDELLDVNTLLRKSDNTILVSPRMTEGIDLVGDLSRFQFFPKVPYPYLGDRWVKEKLKQSQAWYARQTVIKIIQGAGRSIRSEEDWAYTFILDLAFRNLISQNRHMFPLWFYEAIKYININSI